jgi:hypothetical protein
MALVDDRSLYISVRHPTRTKMGTEGSPIDLSGDVQERQPNWLVPTLVGLGFALIAALVYQLIVGGVKIEVSGGRLTIDPSGLIYWWQRGR